MITFEQAIEEAHALDAGIRPSLLLGNGFSCAYSPDFSYARLRDVADFKGLSVDAKLLFTSAESDDFETVMSSLVRSANMLELYSDDMHGLVERMHADCEELKRGLVSAIAQVHPRGWDTVKATRAACDFLRNFEQIFTLNYDFLLYWAINSCESQSVVRTDGFKQGGDGLRWSPSQRGSHRQRVFWLHGGFHLYEKDEYLRKLLRGEGGGLLDQAERYLLEGRYPLVVTEGSSENKERPIASNDYLAFCHERLGMCTGALFVHGMSMSDTDEHVLRRIYAKPSGIQRLFVGFHDPGSEAAHTLVRRAGRLSEERAEQGGLELDVRFYEASTAQIWKTGAAA